MIGLVYAVIYYFLFRFMIRKFNFKTPGREDDPVAEGLADEPAAPATVTAGAAPAGAADAPAPDTPRRTDGGTA
ncbi:PTS system glucose-specific EIICBA component [compost metagenome]